MDFNQNTEGFEKIEENEEVIIGEVVENEAIPPMPPFIDEIKKEKIQIKRDGNIIGSAFLALTATVYFLNVFVYLIYFVLSFINKNAAEILFDPAVMQVEQILFMLIGFLLPFVVVFKLADIRISDLISFSKPKRETFLPFFLLGTGFCSFANILVGFVESIFSSANINYEVPDPEYPEGVFGFLLVLISTVLVPALVEEFVCRGLILGYLKKYGEGFAVLISAFLFGIMHGNFEQAPFAFLVGLVLAYITIKSKTIWIAVLVHGFNNLISVIMSYLPNSLSNYVNLGYLLYILFSLLGAIIALRILNGKDNDLYDFAPAETKIKGGKKAVCFLTSIPILIYLILCLIDSVQYFF